MILSQSWAHNTISMLLKAKLYPAWVPMSFACYGDQAEEEDVEMVNQTEPITFLDGSPKQGVLS